MQDLFNIPALTSVTARNLGRKTLANAISLSFLLGNSTRRSEQNFKETKG